MPRRPLPLPLCLTVLCLAGCLAGCSGVVLEPSGDVAERQRDLLVMSTLLMLLVIVPVMALTVLFAWRYRRNRAEGSAKYEPDWDHSTKLELVIWAAPLLIIITLGAITWAGTHLLDPYRPLDRVSPTKALPASGRPLVVEVVSLDWKWLFIYPEQGIATLNEMAAPVDRPLAIRLTSATVMNAFYVPAMAGMIYTMPGMQTQLHAVMNAPGVFEGFSANYSGAGFTGMRFQLKALDAAGFADWVAQQRKGERLDRARYLALEQPSEKQPVQAFGAVERGLFAAIVGRCVVPGSTCLSMHADAPTAQARRDAKAADGTHDHARMTTPDGPTSTAAKRNAPLRGAGIGMPEEEQ